MLPVLSSWFNRCEDCSILFPLAGEVLAVVLVYTINETCLFQFVGYRVPKPPSEIDRLYIFATLVVFLIRDIVPVWMIALIIGRDLVLAVITLMMNRKGLPPFTVTYLGKAATFNLLYAFPFLLLAQSDGTWGSIAFVAGWSFAIWGIALYISTGISYAREGLSQMRGNRVINS